MIPSQLNNIFKGAIKKKEDPDSFNLEDMIEANKVKFNLTHGKGLRKKHKGKKKKK